MVFAEDRKTARKLKQFERRRVRKVYWAGVSGRLARAEGTRHDSQGFRAGRAELVRRIIPKAPAVLRYRVLGPAASARCWRSNSKQGGCTRFGCRRRPAAIRCWATCNTDRRWSCEGDEPWLRPIALHAHLLEIFSPATQTVIAYTARPPQFWDKLNLPLDAAGE